jgi:hypothetical protein
MVTTPDLPDARTVALVGLDAALVGLVDAIAVMLDLDDVDAEDLGDALNLSTSGVAMLAASGPFAWECLDRLVVTSVLAWDELGAAEARGGVADVFDADERRCFALVTKSTEENLETLTDRVLDKLGGSFTRAISVAVVVTTRMLLSVAIARELDAQGALDVVRSLPEGAER